MIAPLLSSVSKIFERLMQKQIELHSLWFNALYSLLLVIEKMAYFNR